MSSEPFSVRFQVRVYEVDPQLHLNGAVYVQYADHARFACVQAAGVSVEEMLSDGFGPVNLETVIRYHSELRAGDEVDVSCDWKWGEGKTYRVEHVFRRPDGAVAAEVNHVSGLIDLKARRLLTAPSREWLSRAAQPHILGLPATDRPTDDSRRRLRSTRP
ncbi:acyl-CoA thioesterase [Actinomadura sp. KC345]|uniref:acyl-CoA thioesterase n=1 Tax=Actinomadura sp. KC345 TaxID=2530371 RepID=UPI00104B6105|nr:acyl-CoA thioesterase [Actinomadura sp. KC345]TDC49068.1 acyl-CoA thioesterase [Actinomadura sp. KC345]